MEDGTFDYPSWKRIGGRGCLGVVVTMPVDDEAPEGGEETWRCDHGHLGSRSALACAMAEIKRRWTERSV